MVSCSQIPNMFPYHFLSYLHLPTQQRRTLTLSFSGMHQAEWPEPAGPKHCSLEVLVASLRAFLMHIPQVRGLVCTAARDHLVSHFLSCHSLPALTRIINFAHETRKRLSSRSSTQHSASDPKQKPQRPRTPSCLFLSHALVDILTFL